jgi:glycosyltransferase involved in cell wall biosynthesis
MTWALITGEYPPHHGGVADYTATLARELASRGDAVRVFAPPCGSPDIAEPGITVHRLPDVFGARGRRAAQAILDALPHPRAAVVQYVPQAFGMRGCNVAFAAWLTRLRRYPLVVMFHEVAVTVRPETPLTYRLQAAITRVMARFALRAADVILISTPAWDARLRALGTPRAAPDWAPVPSNIALASEPAASAAIRARYARGAGMLLGHFGTYREAFGRETLAALAARLVGDDDALLFVGRGSERFAGEVAAAHPALRGRVHGTGGLASQALADHLGACDLLVQPYEDGVTTRRGSITGALALGIPIATTSGATTEDLWRTSAAVSLAPVGDPEAFVASVRRLAGDETERRRLRHAARTLYAERFAIAHTATLLHRRMRAGT